MGGGRVRRKRGEIGGKGDLRNWRSLTQLQFLSLEQPSFTYKNLLQVQD